MRINFGAGGNILDGWDNRDAETPIEKQLPYPDNCADFILCEHCVEHVTHIEALGFFRECLRILKPGGVMRICVPGLIGLTREHMIDLIVGHGHKAMYSFVLLKEIIYAAGFEFNNITLSSRKECDGHHKVIGLEKDDAETIRIEAAK